MHYISGVVCHISGEPALPCTYCHQLSNSLCSECDPAPAALPSPVICALSCRDLHGSGTWGAYPDAVVPGLGVVEGGQTSTGSAVSWFRRLISGGKLGGGCYLLLIVVASAQIRPCCSREVVWFVPVARAVSCAFRSSAWVDEPGATTVPCFLLFATWHLAPRCVLFLHTPF